MKILRNLIKMLLHEELGRSYQTVNDGPISHDDYPEIEIYQYPAEGGVGYYAQVICKFDDSLSTPLRKFNDSSDADHFIRTKSDEIHRIAMDRDI